MAQPYDATGKELLEADPSGWAAFLGAPRLPGRGRVIDSDLASVTAADKVLWEFAYSVVRVWELDPQRLLAGPLALASFAPIADVPPADVPGVLARVADRVRCETDPASGEKFLTAIGFLLQLRYGAMTAQEWIKNIPNPRDSAIFKVFLDEGQVEGLRSAVLRQGKKKFGTPTPEQEAELAAVTDLARLEALGEKLLDVSTWAELLKPD